MKKGKAFEDLVSWIHTCLADRAQVRPNVNILDKDTGEPRQVDIAIYLTDGPYRMLRIVEVRDHKKPIGSPYIEEISAKRRSVGADAATIVSKSGFTQPAIEKAKAENIVILTYDDARKDAWAAWAETKTVVVAQPKFDVLNWAFDTDSSAIDPATMNNLNAMATRRDFQIAQFRFRIEGEVHSVDLNSLIKQALDQNPSIWNGIQKNTVGTEKTVRITFTKRVDFLADNLPVPVKKLRALLRLRVVEEEIPLTYSVLRNERDGSLVGEVLSATTSEATGEKTIQFMTKGTPGILQPGQKISMRITEGIEGIDVTKPPTQSS
jgi:hypothetical protein